MSTTQYGIGVTKNRFELFDIDDEDPLEVLKLREQEREARKKTKLSEKENKGKELAPKPKVSIQRKGIKETQNLKPLEGQKPKEEVKGRPARIERPERKFTGTDPREVQNNRRNRVEDRASTDFQPREERGGERFDRREYRSDRTTSGFYGEGGDGRGRGRSGPQRGNFIRGGRGGRGSQRPTFDVRGKREYDRQSGSDKTSTYSGVKHVDKREGAGAHNWGNLRDDIVDIQNAPVPDETTWTVEKTEEPAVETNGAIVETEEVLPNTAEEELKELTLDEWKALKAPRQKPTYNIRKAGEGEDPTQWKKMYALQKKKDGEEEEDDDEFEYESYEYPQRVGRQKHVLDIDIHFKDTRGGGRGRGGRGMGRGGPRMGLRGTNGPPAEKVHIARDPVIPKIAPKVDDEHDFPSLG
ncbi:SERPINE1 mRNA-binding protein 1 isoform X2 [Halyomorpha halys]|uniref:SERPINE1 mRNA-binding protein 1 isoform X2 n=1 Tax=Halyomorpha halys TaxID=286706 RepID=UPI000D0C7FDF|nr:plasminogen activator inhibitor 1 RNA-binding protein isoform X2 [Halyomorpha halys]